MLETVIGTRSNDGALPGQRRRSGTCTLQGLDDAFFLDVLYEASAMNVRTSNALDWVNGSDAPEMNSLDVGFMALTDCASLWLQRPRALPSLTA